MKKAKSVKNNSFISGKGETAFVLIMPERTDKAVELQQPEGALSVSAEG